MPGEVQDKELVLPAGTHVFILDRTGGVMSTAVGPQKINFGNTDEPVVYDPSLPRQFKTVSVRESLQKNKVVPKGSYAILKNPHKELLWPKDGKKEDFTAASLQYGRVVNLPGPLSVAPWPGQGIEIVRGHDLKTNEYLIVRVYDEDEARKNWSQGTVTAAAPSAPPAPSSGAQTQLPDQADVKDHSKTGAGGTRSTSSTWTPGRSRWVSSS